MRYLLELYFEGGTTLEQEARLREFFAGCDVPEDLEYARAMFGFFSSAAVDAMPGDVNVPFEAETVAAESPSKEEEPVKATRTAARHGIRRVYAAVSIAAAVMIMAVATFSIIRYSDRPTVYCYVDGQPVTDIEYAALQAQMAARILEGNMRTSALGFAAVNEAAKPMEQIGRALGAIKKPASENETDE